MIKTFSPKSSEVEHEWHLVDATGKTVGRLCSEIAKILTGKHKPVYAPHADTGDFVVVVNAEKVVFTGRKELQKVYYRHSTHPGNLKETTAAELRSKRPEQIIEKGVWGMLPKNKLGRQQLKKLKVYGGAEHPHAAQKPQPLELAS